MNVCELARDDTTPSPVPIAAAFNIRPEQAVKHAIGECDCTNTNARPLLSTTVLNDRLLLRYLVMQARYTMQDIADLFDVSTATIRSALREVELVDGENRTQLRTAETVRVLWVTTPEEFFKEERPRWALYSDEWYEDWWADLAEQA